MENTTVRIEKLHLTDLAVEEIRGNLDLQVEDVVLWCKEAVRQADIIIGHGQCLYVYKNGVAIIIESQSNTIITAHPINGMVRLMQPSDCVGLPEFLYQAIFFPKEQNHPQEAL